MREDEIQVIRKWASVNIRKYTPVYLKAIQKCMDQWSKHNISGLRYKSKYSTKYIRSYGNILGFAWIKKFTMSSTSTFAAKNLRQSNYLNKIFIISIVIIINCIVGNLCAWQDNVRPKLFVQLGKNLSINYFFLSFFWCPQKIIA